MITPETALKLLDALRGLCTKRDDDDYYTVRIKWENARAAIALAEQELAEQEMETDR